MTAGESAVMAPANLLQTQRLAAGGAAAATKSLSSSAGCAGGHMDAFADCKTMRSIKTEHMGHEDKPDWLSFKGTLAFIKMDKEGGA